MIDTTNMNKKSKHLYETLWSHPDFDFPVEKAIVSDNKRSDNSYIFAGTSTSDKAVCLNRLAELFDITNKTLFEEKFLQSCGGDGNEIERIGTLHSSALCALLFFYNVTNENPLTLRVNNRDCKFYYSRFEFQDPVIRKPSNMDITLVGTYTDTNQPVILFLESKFSEYFERVGKSLHIAEGYSKHKYSADIYNDNTLSMLGLSKTDESNGFTIKSKTLCYLEGLKQMVSHYIGVYNFKISGSVTNDDGINSVRDNADIYLGTILFDNGIGDFEISTGVTAYDSYKAKYEKLVDILNSKNPPFNVIKELFSYSMFKDMDFIKEDKIKKFYFNLKK